eukprot:905183-Pyramimonas_sp.AAC.1
MVDEICTRIAAEIVVEISAQIATDNASLSCRSRLPPLPPPSQRQRQREGEIVKRVPLGLAHRPWPPHEPA